MVIASESIVLVFSVLVLLKYMLLEARLETVGSIKNSSMLCMPV